MSGDFETHPPEFSVMPKRRRKVQDSTPMMLEFRTINGVTLLFTATYAGSKLLIRYFRDRDEIEGKDKEFSASMLTRLMVDWSHEQCYEFLWK